MGVQLSTSLPHRPLTSFFLRGLVWFLNCGTHGFLNCTIAPFPDSLFPGLSLMHLCPGHLPSRALQPSPSPAVSFSIMIILSDWLTCLSTSKLVLCTRDLHLSQPQQLAQEGAHLTFGEGTHYSHSVAGETEAQPPIDPRQSSTLELIPFFLMTPGTHQCASAQGSQAWGFPLSSRGKLQIFSKKKGYILPGRERKKSGWAWTCVCSRLPCCRPVST